MTTSLLIFFLIYVSSCSAWKKTDRIEIFYTNKDNTNWLCSESFYRIKVEDTFKYSFCNNPSSYNLYQIKCQLSIKDYGTFRQKWTCSPETTSKIFKGKPFVTLEHKVKCANISYFRFFPITREICTLSSQANIYSELENSFLQEIINSIFIVIVIALFGPAGMIFLLFIGSFERTNNNSDTNYTCSNDDNNI